MNPLYNMLVGAKQGQIPAQQIQSANPPSEDLNAIMGRLQANPAGMLRDKGYNIPDELNGNPQAMVMHLMQSGQIGGQMMNMIRPFLGRFGTR